MSSARCIVHRGHKVLMVKHRHRGMEWWCLPGGAIEDEESPQEAVLRELAEECRVQGKVVRQTGFLEEVEGTKHYTFLVDIGDQQPRLGSGLEVRRSEPLITDLRWLKLSEIPERDRAFLWAAGLLSIGGFLEEVESWGDSISYPGWSEAGRLRLKFQHTTPHWCSIEDEALRQVGAHSIERTRPKSLITQSDWRTMWVKLRGSIVDLGLLRFALW